MDRRKADDGSLVRAINTYIQDDTHKSVYFLSRFRAPFYTSISGPGNGRRGNTPHIGRLGQKHAKIVGNPGALDNKTTVMFPRHGDDMLRLASCRILLYTYIFCHRSERIIPSPRSNELVNTTIPAILLVDRCKTKTWPAFYRLPSFGISIHETYW